MVRSQDAFRAGKKRAQEMTDAMSRREIEDVLSSIRRLVSHDVAPTSPFVSAAQSGSQAGSATGEKLLLTSALRVDGPGAAPQADRGPDSPSPAVSDARSGAGPMPFGPGAQGDDAPAGAGQDAALPGLSAKSCRPAQDALPAQSDAAQASADLPPEDGEMRFAPHSPSLLARISGASLRPEAEPDLSRPMDAMRGRGGMAPHDAATISHDREGAFAEAPLPNPQTTDPTSSLAPPSAQNVEDGALESTLARLEELLAGAVRDDTKAGGARDDAERPEDLIDEGVLYQLVAHIVRQELQGELGEKITRNIRKLVRAEVARELQLRQF